MKSHSIRPQSAAKPSISVLVMHRFRILAEMLGGVLREHPEVTLAGVVQAPELALDQLKGQSEVDILVFDVRSCSAPAQFVRQLRHRWGSLKVLLMGVAPEEEVVELIEAGACAYVPLTATLNEWMRTISQVHRGQAPCCPVVVAAVLDRLKQLSSETPAVEKRAAQGANGLTDMEGKVLEQLATGCSNRELGQQLGVSVSTVKMHVHSILGKLQVERRQDAVRVAAESGPLKLDLPQFRRQLT